MPAFIIDPERISSLYRRPPWPYGINWDSEQSVGLMGWWSLDDFFPFNRAATGPTYVMTPDGTTGLPVFRQQAAPFSAGWFFTAANGHLMGAVSPVGTTPLSLTSWCNPAAIGSSLAMISPSTLVTARYQINVNNTGGINASAVNAGGTVGTATSTAAFAAANTWGLGIGVFHTTTDRRATFNGAFEGTNTDSISPATSTVVNIGARFSASSPGLFFNGLIGDTRIYNRALRSDEQLAMFNPDTRWELYWQPGAVSYFIPPPTGWGPLLGQQRNRLVVAA